MMIDLGEARSTGKFDVPVGSYCNFPRQQGLTVEQAIAALPRRPSDKGYIDIPEAMLSDCVRLCCSLCLLENDPSIISPDVLSKDRDKFDQTGDAEVRREGAPARQTRLGRGAARRGDPALPPSAFDAGLDGGGPGGAQDRAPAWYNRASR